MYHCALEELEPEQIVYCRRFAAMKRIEAEAEAQYYERMRNHG